MKLLVLSNNYPSPDNPNRGVFVYNLVQEFCKLGCQVTVIAPRKPFILKSKGKASSYGKERAVVFRPNFLSASAKSVFGFNTYRISEFLQVKAISSCIRKNKIEFDVAYAHFLNNGLIGVKALERNGKPIFVALGESNLDERIKLYSKTFLQKNLSKISGFITVGPQLSRRLEELNVPPSKIELIPNAVDHRIFYPHDKEKMRRKFGLPKNLKLLIFVGRFTWHKGPGRIIEAIAQLNDVGIILVGSGKEEYKSDKIVFQNRVPSSQVPELLSAADVFVLPTLREGCSNAIVEAMACGLPVISSDIEEVRVQCKQSYSILVDPLNIKELEKAISRIIYDDNLLDKMSSQALKDSVNYDLQKRANSILNFVKKSISEFNHKVAQDCS
ncbi:glycosyltransferase family 4 protein [Robertkochia aurantiaca]|uniref:glycosyltransferase family 4 protein n=1 Tax=Robertkochia aurantiaca TaxID=2873700 RepID=UPI001CCDB139|nr:glycosyltransferase family 4 protein [Robertkochia sp. 3YJGBD-33]